MQAQTMSRALGWFSIGLGLAQLAAPRRIARTTGLPYSPALLRLIGVRGDRNGLRHPGQAQLGTRRECARRA